MGTLRLNFIRVEGSYKVEDSWYILVVFYPHFSDSSDVV